MQPYLQTQYNQDIHPPFIDFEMLKRKYIQEDVKYIQENVMNNLHITNNSKYVTEQEYWNQYYEMKDVCYEWCNGQLEEKPMADLASFIMYTWFLLLLNEYFRTYPEGTIVGLEIGFKMSLPGKTSIRKPDLAFIHKSNPVQMQLNDRSYKGCFDMCIEFLSDSNQSAIDRDIVIKKAEYEQSAIKEYFILDRNHAYTAFYRLNNAGIYEEIEPDNDDVIKSTVLPHFQFRYSDLFSLPSNEQLRNDPVYMHYFQTDYIQQTQRVLKAEKIAANEKRRADNEKRRADDAIAREKKLLLELAKYYKKVQL